MKEIKRAGEKKESARCEFSCIDTLDICNDLTQHFQEYLHRPYWVYKFNIKEYVNNGFDVKGEVVSQCPTEALGWDEGSNSLELRAEDCIRCMHCINRMPKGLYL